MKKYGLIAVCIGCIALGFAWWVRTSLPPELIYQGQPLKAYYLLYQSNGSLTLSECEKQFQEKKIEINPHPVTSCQKGWYGGEYKEPGESVEENYCYWSYIGKACVKDTSDNTRCILLKQEGNLRGTGRFSQLMLIQREGDRLHLHTLDGGDRSFGGIEKASFADKKLVYTKAYTPADLFELWRESFHVILLEPVDTSSLRACAICQAAVMHYEIPQRELTSPPQLKHIVGFELHTGPITPSFIQPVPTPHTLQECFDTVWLTYPNKKKLAFHELNAFFQKVMTLYQKAKK